MPGSAVAPLHIGTSGWTYEGWRADFYAGVPRARWLAHYASAFNAVEVNATFYHALKPATFERWCEATPAAFRFCVKAHRWITHVERLVVEPAAITRERDRAAPLGDKLAVVLWQLPQSLHRDLPRLQRFARQLAVWPQPRHAIEFRHASWFDDEVADCLAAHAIAAVQSDAADWPLWPAVTTDLAYVRLHGHIATYCSRYSARQLAAWAEKIAAWRRQGRAAWVFFDNTDAGHAPRDALALCKRCRGR
ncbi:DUF72 domain-containing protein [Betaproteobacteria bacterium PRO7]|jgi:uncharacterized protein YecE (DUF72 family)|nr:DUF72 domain-containing protein [Burkholderiaceae bacterium]MDL1862151.1 DUF72 domain-containing protein [Betaproteobacteria bacterium PRO7]